MHIIFDQKMVSELKQRYIVLELDTVLQPEMTEPLTLYALIDDIDLDILSNLITLTQRHDYMIKSYKSSEWDTAAELAQALLGKWKGAVDEFYTMVINTCQEYKSNNQTWNGIKYTIPID